MGGFSTENLSGVTFRPGCECNTVDAKKADELADAKIQLARTKGELDSTEIEIAAVGGLLKAHVLRLSVSADYIKPEVDRYTANWPLRLGL